MMDSDTITGSDMYLLYTDPAGKQPSNIRCHRVYDRERFMASQCLQFSDPGGDHSDHRIITLSTREAYMAQLKAVRG